MAVSFPFFVMGYYLRNIIRNLNNYNVQLRLVLIIVSVAILILLSESQIVYGAGRINGNIALAYIRGFAGCVMVILICTLIERIPKLAELLAIIGASTLTVLGLHFHFIIPSKIFYSLVFGNASEMNIVYALIVSILTVLCLTYVHKFLSNKVPIIIGRSNSK